MNSTSAKILFLFKILLKSVKVCSCSQNRTVFARDQRVNTFRNETCAELGLDSSLCRNVNIAIKAQGKDQVFSLCRYVHAVMLLLCHYVRMFTVLQTQRPSYVVMFMWLCRYCELGLSENLSLRI